MDLSWSAADIALREDVCAFLVQYGFGWTDDHVRRYLELTRG